MAANHGPFIWYEYASADKDRAAGFLSHAMGWTIAGTGMPGMDYTVLNAPDGGIGGLVSTDGGRRAGWLGYIAVEDVDRTVEAYKSHGGAVVTPALDLPGVGRIAVVSDPDGVALAVMKPGSSELWSPEGMRKPGHCGWHELYAGDGQKAMDFYAAVFGWTRSTAMDMGPMGTYQIFAQDGADIGGIMTKTPDLPAPMWNYYFNVDAVEAAAARAGEHGAKIIMGPHQVPGGGWVIQTLDPDGNMLSLLSAVK